MFDVHHHHHHEKTDVRPEPPLGLKFLLGLIVRSQERIMIDTSKILSEVSREKADSALLRALVQQTLSTLNDVRSQLAAAVANNDPAALAAVQEQLDAAASTLATDNTAAEAALAAANPPAPAPAPDPSPAGAPTTPTA